VRIGLIADTHGLLRPEVLEAFADVAHIVHAGDVGTDQVLAGLEAIAPVTAVAGNVDGGLRRRLPETAELELGGAHVAIVHGHRLPGRKPAAVVARFPQADLVVFGHSHIPVLAQVDGVLAVNPGSAGPRRFGQRATAALAVLGDGEIDVRILDLP
jgi:putative phosphoesterase